jgi:hypothetical protein
MNAETASLKAMHAAAAGKRRRQVRPGDPGGAKNDTANQPEDPPHADGFRQEVSRVAGQGYIRGRVLLFGRR